MSGVAPASGGDGLEVARAVKEARFPWSTRRAYRPPGARRIDVRGASYSAACVNAPARAHIPSRSPLPELRAVGGPALAANLSQVNGRVRAAAAFAAVRRVDEATEELVRAGVALRSLTASPEVARLHAEICVVSGRLGYTELADGHRRVAESMLALIDDPTLLEAVRARLATRPPRPVLSALDQEVERLEAVAAGCEAAADAVGVARALRQVIRLTSGQHDATRRTRLDVVDARVRLELLEHERDDLRRRAFEDPLTGLANRRAIEERLPGIVASGPVTLAVIDIDRFKAVNDEHSHQAGDGVLCGVARLLARHCRSQDLVARMGGDEFLVVLVGGSAARATSILDRLRKSVANSHWDLVAPGLRVSVSVGGAYSQDGGDAEELMARADEALRGAKTAGRDRISVVGAVRDGNRHRIGPAVTERNEDLSDAQVQRAIGEATT